ncbi:hypothetical protein BCR39DRAFT_263127 [Naematelia encephala]|uniref:Uncharacterized protein n=1 Tax=Naematelia encephala TaxID=71784 RepID=A0A1Y2BFU2_9TREE|nr:hypothetical protein BCR39DRAFT_263127 [Naematelia encephala]
MVCKVIRLSATVVSDFSPVSFEDPIAVQQQVTLVTIAFQTGEDEPMIGQVVNVSKELLKSYIAPISDMPTSSSSKAEGSQVPIAQEDVLASNPPDALEQVDTPNVLPNGMSTIGLPVPELELAQPATNPPAVSQKTVDETLRPSSPEAAPQIPAKGRAKGRRSAPSPSPIVESSEDENMSSRGGKKSSSRKSEASDIFWSAYDSNGILTAAQRRQIAQRGVCAICLASQTHLQKDCPVVKDGLESLQRVLAEREEEAEKSQGSLAADFAPSIEAIKNWIQRLTNLKKRVISGAQTQSGGSWTSPVRLVHDAATPSPELPSVPTATVSPINLISPSSVEPTNDLTEDAGKHESASNALDPPNSPPSDTSFHTPASAPTSTAGEQFLPQIHLRALQRPRKAGSLSGLSVSDARIETEDSASESESGSDSASVDNDEQLESEDDESSDEENADSKSATSDTESLSEAASESGSESNESDDGRSVPSDPEQALQHFMSKPLSRKEQETARLSAIHLPASTPLVEAVDPSSDSEESASDDAEPQALPAGSRNRAESVSSIGDFGDAASQASSEAHSEIRPISQIPAVKPTDESISATSSAATSPSQVLGERARRFAEIDEMAGSSPAVEQFPGVVALNEAIADEERPEKEARKAVLVQETFGSDALGAPWNGRAKVIDGLPSPPSSNSGMDAEATQLDPRVMEGEVDGDLTPRAMRGAPASQSMAPPAEAQPAQQQLLSPIQTSQRRLRSKASDSQDAIAASQDSVTRETRRTSRQPSATPKQRHAELVVELSPRITTRSRSKELTVSPRIPTRSLVPASPGGRKSSRTDPTPPPRLRSLRSASAGIAIDVDGGLTANGTSQRTTRNRRFSSQQSSQIDELDSSQPNIPPLVQSAEQNGDALSSSAPQPSQLARIHESPLFMTQGSQPLVAETQAYNVFPSSIEPERSQSPSSDTVSRSNGSVTRGSRRVVRPASPILEEDEGSATPVPNGHTNGTVASSSAALESDIESDNVATTTNAADEDDESSIFIPPARTTLAAPSRQYSLASSQPSLSIPTLSGLSKDALRNRSFMRGASSQPVKSSSSGMLNGLGKDESSDSEASNSSDDEVPNGLKGRIAGRRPGIERRRTNGNMVGW